MRQHQRKSRPRAKVLRQKMTDAEVILWSRLRRPSKGRAKFRRQHPIGPYIADFACIARWLVVELDGATHSTGEEVAYDARRDAYMKERGWRIVRVQNDDVYHRLDDVLDWIWRALPLPPPPPLRGPPPP
jgi:very-short-patch-repair endonuclease